MNATEGVDYVLIGVIVGKETLGKLNIPGIKVNHLYNKLVCKIGNQVKLVDIGNQVKRMVKKENEHGK